MKELTIISGKGGTGKTTITGAFASISNNAILADCDIDAPDLQLILNPNIQNEEKYIGTATAKKVKDCSNCKKCIEACRFNAIDENININELKCEGCGACEFICPEDAINLQENTTGSIYTSSTRFGPMVHAELEVGEEASGKMVTEVRNKAKKIASDKNLLIVDGSPGVGCPVISSIRGSNQILVVTEPTVSGIHDLERVLDVGDHFNVNSAVCINKYDINREKSKEIEKLCNSRNVPVIGKLPYDDIATEAMINEKTVTEYKDSELSHRIKNAWEEIKKLLNEDR